MKKKTAAAQRKKGIHIPKRTVAAAIVAALALQPCFSFVSLAYSTSYEYGYDNYYSGGSGDYYYDKEGNRVDVTNVTKTYDNGTKYTAEYKYDSNKRLIYANIKEADGSKSTVNRTYKENRLVSESNDVYDAASQEEVHRKKEYENAVLIHSFYTTKYPDGTNTSEELWYQTDGKPIKGITIDQNALTTQTDYVYNEKNQLISEKSVGSDGSIEEEAYQYDEAGEVNYYKQYEYNASLKTTYQLESRLEGEGPSRSVYTAELNIVSDGQEYKSETWRSSESDKTTKSVITYPDGSQTTEDYTYNSDGDETLYIKRDSEGMLIQRETTYRQDGETQVSRDRAGNTRTISTGTDKKTNEWIREDTVSNADGSYSYTKQIYSAGTYSTKSSISRERTAEGIETYHEYMVQEDGGYIEKSKGKDGTLTEIVRNADRDIVSRKITGSDGKTEEYFYEYNEHGLKTALVTRHSNGEEDRVTYEYDESGNLIKSTETRKNGISAVTHYQSETDSKSETTTFNNGYQMTIVWDTMDSDTRKLTCTYSAGEIIQDIVMVEGETASAKIIYRDGRTEEFVANYYEDDEWDGLEEKLEEHMDAFNDLAWGTQTAAAEAEETSPVIGVIGPGIN